MYTLDQRDVSNNGGYDWCHSVSVTYGLAKWKHYHYDLEKDFLGCSDDYWQNLIRDNQELYNAEEDCFEEIELEFTVHITMGECPVCYGKGSHVKPGIDSHAITSDEWDRDWSYEDRDRYFNGFYDQPCKACNATGKYPYLDREKTEDFIVNLYDKIEEEKYYHEAERAAEMRFGY